MSAYTPALMRIMLDCNHVVEIQVPIPEVGHEQYCRRCSLWRIVIAHLDNYSVRCLSRHSYSRTFGDNQEAAMLAARKHVISNPRHKIQVSLNGKRLCEVDNVSETLFVTPEQLSQISDDAQQILRNIDVGA